MPEHLVSVLLVYLELAETRLDHVNSFLAVSHGSSCAIVLTSSPQDATLISEGLGQPSAMLHALRFATGSQPTRAHNPGDPPPARNRYLLLGEVSPGFGVTRIPIRGI